jgi:hypothetical protein
MKAVIKGLAVLAFAALSLSADTLYLRDGRTVRGTFMGGTSRDVRFMPEGGASRVYAISSVNNVVFGDDQVSSNSSVDNSGSVFGTRSATNDAGTRSRDAARTTVPSGTVVTIRTIDPIDSDSTNVGATFRGSLDEPLVVNGQTIAPKGADALLKVTKVQQSGAISGTEEVAVVLSQINANGRTYNVDTNLAEVAAKSRGKQSAEVIGGTAVVGAILGAIAGGGKGAAIGAAAGAGAGVAVQVIRGQRVKIPSESKLDFTLSQPLYID